jgi:hypothetical protein
MCPHCGKSTRAEDPGEPLSTAPIVQKAASPQPAATPTRTPSPPPAQSAPRAATASAPRAATPAQNTRKHSAPVLVLAVGCLAGAAAIGIYFHWGPSRVQAASQPVAHSPSNVPSSAPDAPNQALAETNPPTPITTTAKPAKSTNDFKISDLAVERPKGTRGSKLTYVIGSVENLSDIQRFGVKIELDLLDQRGVKIDSAMDYCDVLGSHQTWPFRAQAHDSRAFQARVASIREDN